MFIEVEMQEHGRLTWKTKDANAGSYSVICCCEIRALISLENLVGDAKQRDGTIAYGIL